LRKLLIVALVIVALVIGWGVLRKNRPPEVAFARVKQGPLASSLVTNGKAEPYEWQAVRSDVTGVIRAVLVKEGQAVTAGAVLAEISDPTAQTAIEAAEARLAEARANLSGLEAGGKPAELAEIENSVALNRTELQQAQRDRDALARLVEKNAATRSDLTAAEDKIRQLQIEAQGLEKRSTSLVAKPDVAAARARVQEAEAALKQTRAAAAQSAITAPISGMVYDLAARPGAFLNRGDLVANVGRMEQMRVTVYVDEPELGRVTVGSPVTITWDALPGKTWKGVVEKKPTTVQPLGSRQVGEVRCTIANPSGELATGANVNAEILTATAQNAITIPKETLRHDTGGDYVFALVNDHIERRPVQPGISSITSVQITRGLAAGDAVALPSDTPLNSGERVDPVIR
jgi:HlyD family secretion protein